MFNDRYGSLYVDSFDIFCVCVWLVNDLDWNGFEIMGFRGGDFVVLFLVLDICWLFVEGLL